MDSVATPLTDKRKTNEGTRYPNKTIAYCIEEIIGRSRSGEDLAKEIGCTPSTVSSWLERHWFGSRTNAVVVKESSINSDNRGYQ